MSPTHVGGGSSDVHLTALDNIKGRGTKEKMKAACLIHNLKHGSEGTRGRSVIPSGARP